MFKFLKKLQTLALYLAGAALLTTSMHAYSAQGYCGATGTRSPYNNNNNAAFICVMDAKTAKETRSSGICKKTIKVAKEKVRNELNRESATWASIGAKDWNKALQKACGPETELKLGSWYKCTTDENGEASIELQESCE